MADGSLFVEPSKHHHHLPVHRSGVTSHGGRPLQGLDLAPSTLLNVVDMQLGEEFPGLVKRIERRVCPSSKKDQCVLVQDECGAGFRAGVGAHSQRSAPHP